MKVLIPQTLMRRRLLHSVFYKFNGVSIKLKISKSQRTFCASSILQNVDQSAVCSIQPIGGLHLGHYFGAIQQCLQLQDSGHDLYFCIADLHGLSSLPSKEDLKDNIIVTAASLIACGIDPSKSVLFQQSCVPHQAQLDWIIHSIVDQVEPTRYSEHDSKIAAIKEVTLGQYVSPLLLCSDYLLYKTRFVPVGDASCFHLKMSQNYSRLFNEKFGKILTVPEDYSRSEFPLIRSLRQPNSRMTRHEADPRGRIQLLDPPEVIVEKCKKAVTDFTSEVYYDIDKRPGVSNLMLIHSYISGMDLASIKKQSVGLETAQYKLVVADALVEHLRPYREKVASLLSNRDHLWNTLDKGAAMARLRAEETIQLVYQSLGFLPKSVIEPSSLSEKQHSIQLNSLVSSTTKSSSNLDPPEQFRKKIIFSGIQPTGVLHLGNYFGAVKQWVDLQKEGHDVTICIVDQHAITVPQSSCTLHDNILSMAASIIACGVDPSVACLFQQSLVPQHAQLNAILRNVTNMALLLRQAHYKDKLKSISTHPSMGLFAYPVLQAADILLYKTTHVPVGDDQKQHIQLARSVARSFNKKCGENILRLPSPMILDDDLARLKSLCQPDKKMSKSEENPNSRIGILDSADSISTKILAATIVGGTDGDILNDLVLGRGSNSTVPEGLVNLVAIHSIVSGVTTDAIQQEFGGKDVAAYKVTVADAVEEHLNPIRSRAVYLLKHKSFLMDIMDRGAQQARLRAQDTLQIVHDKAGLTRR